MKNVCNICTHNIFYTEIRPIFFFCRNIVISSRIDLTSSRWTISGGNRHANSKHYLPNCLFISDEITAVGLLSNGGTRPAAGGRIRAAPLLPPLQSAPFFPSSFHRSSSWAPAILGSFRCGGAERSAAGCIGRSRCLRKRG